MSNENAELILSNSLLRLLGSVGEKFYAISIMFS